jgi:hypothetical protein
VEYVHDSSEQTPPLTSRRAAEQANWQLTTRKPSCLICALRQAIGLVFPDKNVLVTVS